MAAHTKGDIMNEAQVQEARQNIRAWEAREWRSVLDRDLEGLAALELADLDTDHITRHAADLTVAAEKLARLAEVARQERDDR
jgi:inorganic triphosphatase YgiF